MLYVSRVTTSRAKRPFVRQGQHGGLTICFCYEPLRFIKRRTNVYIFNINLSPRYIYNTFTLICIIGDTHN